MVRRVILIAFMLSLPLARSAVWAQGAASPAKSLDLDKLLVADEEGDLLTEEKPAAAQPASDSAAAGQPSTWAADGQPVGEGEGAKAADSAGRASAQQSGRRGPPSAGTVEADAAETGPAIVEDGRTINFAQNLKEYRSPRLAMLLSLLVPGLGQAYSRSYVKTAAFGAAEAAAIGFAVYFNKVAKTKKNEAYKFADGHFEVERIKSYDSRLRDAILYRDSTIEVEKDSIPLPYDQYFYDAAVSKSVYYYESIRGKDFTPGWIDCNLTLEDVLGRGEKDTIAGKDSSLYMFFNYDNDDMFYYVKRIFDGGTRKFVLSDEPVLGHSANQAKYNAMVDESNSYRDYVNYMFYVIILNHIASAIDAGFTARAYNARLLGEDNSAWNRLSVEQRFVFTGSEFSPGVALRLRF